MEESLVCSWEQHLACRSFMTGSDSYHGRNSSSIKCLSVFLWHRGNKSNSTYTWKGSPFDQSFQDTTLYGKQGKLNKVFIITTHCFAMYCKRQTEKRGPSLDVVFFYLLWLVLFLSKSCIFLCVWCLLSKEDWFSCRLFDSKTWEHA